MTNQPRTDTVTAETALESWDELVQRVQRGESRVLVEEHGSPVAAIVSPRDLLRLRQLDEQRKRSFEILAAFAEPFKDMPADEIEREVAKAIAEVRAENRERRKYGAKTP